MLLDARFNIGYHLPNKIPSQDGGPFPFPLPFPSLSIRFQAAGILLVQHSGGSGAFLILSAVLNF